MEHHYSLTGRMLAIFVGGLFLLAILIFAAGLLAGREWGANEAAEGANAAQRSRLSPATPAPAPATPQATPALVPAAPQPAVPPAPATSGGAIRPAETPAPPPAVPAAPAVPALPKAPSPPATFAPPPAKSSGARGVRATELALSSGKASSRQAAEHASAVPGRQDRAASGDTEIRGFVVYVGAFADSAKAENLAEELQRRNLAARTSAVERPGRKPLVTVYVGPFSARAGAEAVLPEIRAAGLDETMIRAVP